ncbi:Dabb family protein [Saccharibacillus sp. CPCC 101409]|uniref:Dabb family protein n=1 Tax=Saccharibacillus sp. CPCC 101409 TaxID=3058041 RepID=UPI0026722A36|nr:Dabb family protein [Saccharibacillus sp. CPCC 101409]MDO3408700.1 Dabb family protein [Saccharibacillus sp. CPCC 101409]
MSSIQHMVTFSLHAGKDNEEAERFLRSSLEELSAIPGVQQFQVFRQVSAKNEYDYGFSMVFADQSAYDAYNNHPVHVNYVRETWDTRVRAFQEIDLIAYS